MGLFLNIDCMEGMKQYPGKYFDLAIVDPPYGINIGKQGMGAGGGVAPHKNRSHAQIGGGGYFGGKKKANRGRSIIIPKIYEAFDDSHPPKAEYFEELKRVAKNQIIWGGGITSSTI